MNDIPTTTAIAVANELLLHRRTDYLAGKIKGEKAFSFDQLQNLLYLIQYKYYYHFDTLLFKGNFINTERGAKLADLSQDIQNAFNLSADDYLNCLNRYDHLDERNLTAGHENSEILDEMYQSTVRLPTQIYTTILDIYHKLGDLDSDLLLKHIQNNPAFKKANLNENITFAKFDDNLQLFLKRFVPELERKTVYHLAKSNDDPKCLWLIRNGFTDLNDNLAFTCFVRNDGLAINNIDFSLTDGLMDDVSIDTDQRDDFLDLLNALNLVKEYFYNED